MASLPLLKENPLIVLFDQKRQSSYLKRMSRGQERTSRLEQKSLNTLFRNLDCKKTKDTTMIWRVCSNDTKIEKIKKVNDT